MITRRNPSIFLDDLHLPAVLQYCWRVPCPGKQDTGFLFIVWYDARFYFLVQGQLVDCFSILHQEL